MKQMTLRTPYFPMCRHSPTGYSVLKAALSSEVSPDTFLTGLKAFQLPVSCQLAHHSSFHKWKKPCRRLKPPQKWIHIYSFLRAL